MNSLLSSKNSGVTSESIIIAMSFRAVLNLYKVDLEVG